jgi:DNA-binding MarR family transcriptional regulator
MSMVSMFPHITTTRAARETLMDKSRVTRAIDNLVENGLIRREANPEDKRSNLLTLTTKGEELYIELSKLAMRIQRRCLNSLTDEERNHFNNVLIKLDASVNQLEAELEAGELED